MGSNSFVFLLFILFSCANCDFLLQPQNGQIDGGKVRLKKSEKFNNALNTGHYEGILRLKNGIINGTIGYTKSGRQYMQFYGIPFAEPPVGELRFKNPVPAKPWNGIRDASQPPPKCIQPNYRSGGGLAGQEDCLYLNVFVPKDLFIASSGKIPVMIGIHGGAFTTGACIEYTPDYIMERDVIFVTTNYRLSLLGFFGLNNDQLSGNFGLKDQSLAIRWVSKNIARFGGDPQNVTLIGQSAGSASVHLQMFSPLSKGLFQKAIMQSGSAFSRWAVANETTTKYKNKIILQKTGCDSNDTLEILKCLQSVPAEDLTAIGLQFDGGVKLAPIVESKVKNRPFLPVKPAPDTYQTRVPWLTGVNSGEGAMFVQGYLSNGTWMAKQINSNRRKYIPNLNQYDITAKPEDIDTVTQKVIDFYFGAEKIGLDTASELVNMMTDSTFMQPFRKTVQSSNESQYVYLYDHEGTSSFLSYNNLTLCLGVGHAHELPLIYRQESFESRWNLQDKKVSSNLLKFWINFAISGDPNRHCVKKVWKPVQSEDIEYLHIKTDSMIMKKNPFQERFEFWESLPTGWN
ncbi:esterase E4-like [Planococcus citri]|uniref:esterase E4-like n=1 Tax=Planococcus citri TaxID=170843 RepID=UPI0031F7A183